MDSAFAAPSAQGFLAMLKPTTAGLSQHVREHALAGGMPTAHVLPAGERRAWYESYRQTFLERDLRQLSEISHVPDFARVTNLALLRSGNCWSKSLNWLSWWQQSRYIPGTGMRSGTG